MPVQFILGRAGAGKTRRCLDELAARLADERDSSPLILIVPEQASFQMERALALRSPGRGYVRAEVLSFSRLADRVLDPSGEALRLLGRQARPLALRVVLARRAAELGPLATPAKTPGFVRQLDGLIEELIQERISPAELVAAAAQLDDPAAAAKVRSLAGLFQDYCEWLGPSRIDVAMRQEALRGRLRDAAWLHGATVWIDGFAGFTGQEIETLVALGQVARDVAITLLVDPSDAAVADDEELSLFGRTAQTRRLLETAFRDAGVAVGAAVKLSPELTPRFRGVPELARLERAFCDEGSAVDVARSLAPEQSSGERARAVRIIAFERHREELRAAARFIRERITDSNGALRLRDFAIIARDLEPFADLVAEVLDEYGLPYFLDRRRPAGTHPLCRLVRAALDAIRDDFPRDAMLRLIRGELLPIDAGEIAELERLVEKSAARGYAWWSLPQWALPRDGGVFARLRGRSPRTGEGGEAVHDVSPAADAARLRVVSPLAEMLKLAGGGTATGAMWARSLYSLLSDWGIDRRLNEWVITAQRDRQLEHANTHRQAWSAICQLLDDVHELLADMPLSFDEFADVIESALRDLSFGLAPPAIDQVLVSSIERSRHPDIKFAWLFAFNEGIFPNPPGDDALISAEERTELSRAGLERLRSRREEAFGERLLAYIAMTRPSNGLVISFSRADDEGRALPASPLLADVRAALPEVEIESGEVNPAPTCVTEFAWELLRASARGDESRYERIRRDLAASADEYAALQRLLRGRAYRNDAEQIFKQPPSPDLADAVRWRGSISEIENWLRCPFKHFAGQRLGIEEPGKGRAPNIEFGNLAHDFLAEVTMRAQAAAKKRGVQIGKLADADFDALLTTVSAEFWSRQVPSASALNADRAFLIKELVTPLLRDLVRAQADRWRCGDAEPIVCEQSFGRDRARSWPAVVIRLPQSGVGLLHGEIDRVDTCEVDGQRWAIIYDYKTTSAAPRQSELIGPTLQILAYALAAEGVEPPMGPMRVGAVLITPRAADTDPLDKDYFAECGDAERLMHLFRGRGLIVDKLVPRLDRDFKGRSAVIPVQRKADGAFYANSPVLTADELEALLDRVRTTLMDAVSGIVSGGIEPLPLVVGRKRACLECRFQSICRFDRRYNAVNPINRAAKSGGDATSDRSGAISQ